MRLSLITAALGVIVVLAACSGGTDTTSTTQASPNTTDATTDLATTSTSSTTTSQPPVSSTSTTEAPADPAAAEASNVGVVPAGFQWWDASESGFAVAIPETWVIVGALDAETKQAFGVDPDPVVMEAPILLAYNPTNEEEVLVVSVVPPTDHDGYAELEGMTETDLREMEDDLEAATPGAEVTARIVYTAQGVPVLHTSMRHPDGLNMEMCGISAPNGQDFIITGTLHVEQLDVVMDSFSVVDRG